MKKERQKMKKDKSLKIVSTALRLETPGELIKKAIAKGSNLEQLKELLSLKERYEAGEATKAYNLQMALVHKEIPSVPKTLTNAHTHSKYAALDGIINATKRIYTEHGFSVSFYEGDTDRADHVRVMADVMHQLGHKETYWYDIPMDGVGIQGNANMTKIHAKASSTAYARRYLMCMIFNIPTVDDDAQAAGKLPSTGKPVELITATQRNTILDGLLAKDIKLVDFLKHEGFAKLDDMPQSRFKQAMIAINGAVKRTPGGK